jgi:hypothetical protein
MLVLVLEEKTNIIVYIKLNNSKFLDVYFVSIQLVPINIVIILLNLSGKAEDSQLLKRINSLHKH